MNLIKRAVAMRLALATTVISSGCTSSLSGLGSTESFACQAPIGAQCTSISGVYANAAPFALRNGRETGVALPSFLALTARPQGLAPTGASTGATSGATSAVLPGAPANPPRAALRSPARVVRLWIAPWEDADGDLHDASFIHVVVDTGRWLIERVRPAPHSRLDIATPPLAPSTAPAAEAKSPVDLAPTEP